MGKCALYIRHRRFLLILLLCLPSVQFISAQVNLVENGSFEFHTGCPGYQNQLFLAPPWYNPCNWNPDYYHACGDSCFGVPNNHYGIGYQQASQGVAYAGIHTYSYALNLREYLGQKLQQPLKTGYNYAMGFKVCAAEGCSRVLDLLGAAIVTDSIECVQSVPYVSLINLIPQVCNTPGNVLSDSMNWVQIADTFQAAGGEKYLYVGDFFDDKTNTVISVSWGNITNVIAYYYIDEVFIYELGPSAVGMEESELSAATSVFPNPANDRISLSFSVPPYDTEIEIAIYELSGRLVLLDKCVYHDNGCEMDVASLPNGSYICVARTDGGRQCRAKFSIIRN